MVRKLQPLPSVDWLEPERLAIRPRRRLRVSEWAEEHMKITEGPMVGEGAIATPWTADTFPLQRTIVESIDEPKWGKTYIMTAPQAFGKTQCAALPTILHAIHHRRVSALYVAARAALCKTQWEKKIEPAIKADDDMRGLLYENPDFGGDKTCRKFTNGASLHFAGAESVGALAGFTVAVIVCDDMQAYPGALSDFANPADVAWERLGAYPAEDISQVGIGTAGTIDCYLWRAIRNSAFYCPFVPCPSCETYQIIEFSRMQYNPDDIAATLDGTWLKCANPDCEHHIVFDELPGMLDRHLWVSCPPGEDWVTKPDPGGVKLKSLESAKVYPDTDRNTNVAGFWANAYYWPLGKTWGERAVDFIAASGDPDERKNWQQQKDVIPYEEPEEDENALTVEAMAEHRAPELLKGIVPKQADVVTLTVDVHDYFLYYIVRAWRKADGTSWLIDAGTMSVHGPKKSEGLSEDAKKARVGYAIREALDDLWAMEAEGWKIEGGGQINAAICLIDGGHRPDAVGQFCMQRNAGQRLAKWRMIIGVAAGNRKAPRLWTGKMICPKGSYPHRQIGVNEAKTIVRELLSIPRTQAGAWHTYSDVSLEAYHKHMVSEHLATVIRQGREVQVWEQIRGRPNHWWDCEVYQIAAAIACEVRLIGAEVKRAVVTDYFKKLKANR